MSGAAQVFLVFTGTFGTDGALTLSTVVALIAAPPAAAQSNPIGIIWQLRVINVGTTQTLTMTTNTGWTLSGTATLATATFRDFVVTITSATTASIQNVGPGSRFGREFKLSSDADSRHDLMSFQNARAKTPLSREQDSARSWATGGMNALRECCSGVASGSRWFSP
ncbi:hypothetical protein M3I54_41420 [Paraburkholderia sp. CNPSo 3274]|uniref:hypothetical protein n=1 Tax=Paraburkholderia sp. CNPSo 3274 TaxID=2940932 RepID=UPI0020B6981B|nr:hypothetical protein [Paraburkholderia sp. CNPSo 3274]MCP3713251.1 hypothetical protein [Paraburkholderia sp. CNPSo 3274]